jgi:V/A-type H+-transporting ATPase subunit C
MIYLRMRLLETPMEDFRDYYTPFGRIDITLFEQATGETMETQGKVFADTDYGVLIADGLEDFKEQGTLFRFESMINNYLLERLLDGRRITFGVEPLLAYFALRENEIRVIRAILVAKSNGIKPETLRERLLIDHV